MYAALGRLEERGYVRALPGDDRRRPYAITPSGSKVLAQRLTAMKKFAAGGLSRLRTRSMSTTPFFFHAGSRTFLSGTIILLKRHYHLAPYG